MCLQSKSLISGCLLNVNIAQTIHLSYCSDKCCFTSRTIKCKFWNLLCIFCSCKNMPMIMKWLFWYFF